MFVKSEGRLISMVLIIDKTTLVEIKNKSTFALFPHTPTNTIHQPSPYSYVVDVYGMNFRVRKYLQDYANKSSS